MLRPFSHIKNFALAARDGEVGKVKELYFDDQNWIVRYVVVDTGSWLEGRKVLLLPTSFGAIADESKLIAVHLTKERIENSPPIDADKPVSRQHEEEWHRYYGYPGYWLVPESIAFGAVPVFTGVQAQAVEEARRAKGSEERGDPHLRSTSEVTGCSIHTTDGEIGHVDDFIIDDEGWVIRYVVISRSWWSGRKLLLSPHWIERVSWEESAVFVPLSFEAIKNAPEWDELLRSAAALSNGYSTITDDVPIGRSRFEGNKEHGERLGKHGGDSGGRRPPLHARHGGESGGRNFFQKSLGVQQVLWDPP